MAYSTQFNSGLGFYNKPRYSHEVLVGNWFEERAAKDPSFLPQLENSLVKSGGSTNRVSFKENDTPGHPPNVNESEKRHNAQESSSSKDKVEGGSRSKDTDTICSRDPLRGYYCTTYKRAYGPRQGYIYMDSLNSSLNGSKTFQGDRDGAAKHNLAKLDREEDCKRCEQLAETYKDSDTSCYQGAGHYQQNGLDLSQNDRSPCPRCLQLAAL